MSRHRAIRYSWLLLRCGPRILFVLAIFGRQTATHPMISCSLGALAPRPRRDPLAGRSTFPVAAGLELDGALEPAPVPPDLVAAGGRKRALPNKREAE
jgi:hypothetical protein